MLECVPYCGAHDGAVIPIDFALMGEHHGGPPSPPVSDSMERSRPRASFSSDPGAYLADNQNESLIKVCDLLIACLARVGDMLRFP